MTLFCLQLSHLDDAMTLFLASLPQDEYEIILQIFHKFELCELKDQSLSRAQRGTTRVSKLDCKGGYFKPGTKRNWCSNQERGAPAGVRQRAFFPWACIIMQVCQKNERHSGQWRIQRGVQGVQGPPYTPRQKYLATRVKPTVSLYLITTLEYCYSMRNSMF